MGFFGTLGKGAVSFGTGGHYKAIKSLAHGDVKGAARNAALGDVGGYLYDKAMGKPKDMQTPDIDPRMAKLQKMQEKEAKDFHKQLPGLEREQQNQAEQTSRRDLAGQLSGIKSNANSRGLLYSGLRAGAESSAAGQAASQLAAQKAAINSRLEGTAKALDQAALGGQMGYQGLMSQQQDIQQANELAQKQARSSALGGLFSAGGSIGGAALGKK